MTNKLTRTQLTISIAAICILLLVGSAFGLERTGIIDIIPNENITDITGSQATSSNSSTGPRSINDVDYSPASEADKSEIESKKATGSIDTPRQTNPDYSEPIEVVLSAAGQDNSGGPVIVRTILSNVSTGSCTLSLAQGNITQRYTSDVTWTGTYYSCGSFDVPLQDLSAGTWQLIVTVNDGLRTGEVSRTINVEG